MQTSVNRISEFSECFPSCQVFVKIATSKIRFLVNIFVKYRDYKERQRQITNYDRFWIRKCNKNFKDWITKCNGVTKCDKFELQIAMELQSMTDYKVMQYNINTKASRISTLSSGKIDKYEYARVEEILPSN